MVPRSTRASVVIAMGLLCVLTGCSQRAKEVPSAHRRGVPPRSNAGLAVAREIFPYSLIPGGVQTAADLGVRRLNDRALNAHYLGLGARLLPATLNGDRWLYASYRIADSIYWTKNRVLVHAGEGVLTDGKNLVRARCGNRLSDKPQLPVRAFEPPIITTDRFTTEIVSLPPPELVPNAFVPLIPDLPVAVPPTEETYFPPDTPLVVAPPGSPVAPPVEIGSGVLPIIPYIPIAPVITPSAPITPITPVTPVRPQNIVIPEPSTTLLLPAGLFLLFAVSASLKRRIELNIRQEPCLVRSRASTGPGDRSSNKGFPEPGTDASPELLCAPSVYR